MKKTLVLGASLKPERYSNIATKRLVQAGHEVIPMGLRAGEIAGVNILVEQKPLDDIDTITLYLNPARQKAFYDYILELRPRRIIFNPGTENPELVNLARANGIEPVLACTLVMLSISQY